MKSHFLKIFSLCALSFCWLACGFSSEKNWFELVDSETLWEVAFLNENDTISFSQIENWQTFLKDSSLTIPENKKGICFKTQFNIDSPEKIEELILDFNYKYSIRFYINDVLCYEAPRTLISPETHTEINPKEILFREYWRGKRRVLDNSLFATNLKSGKNIIVVQVFNPEENSTYHPNKMMVFASGNNLKGFSSANITEKYESFTDSKLPIFKINTTNEAIPNDPKINASLNIVSGENIHLVSDSGIYYPIKIERRGFTSQSFTKKSYGFTIYQNGLKKEAELASLPPADKWVLYGPYADKSLIRNALTYRLYEKMGHYAPRTSFVDLVVNNNYQGLYVLTEKIEIAENKINIPKYSEDENGTPSGAYLLEIDRNAWKSIFPPFYDTSSVPSFYEPYSPKKENISPENQLKIQTQYNAFEKSIYHNQNTFEHLDLNSFIDFFIISEFTKNIDAYRLSTFLYNKNINDSIPKFYIDPIWDFNFAYGLTNYNDGFNPEGFVFTSDKHVPFWWGKLYNNNTFNQALKTRYVELRKTTLTKANINNTIDSLVNIVEQPSENNFKKWTVLNATDFWPNYYLGKTYEDEINYLKKWINQRLEFLDSEFLAKTGKTATYYEVQILNNPEWLEKVKQKAIEKNISLEEMVKRDAEYMVKN